MIHLFDRFLWLFAGVLGTHIGHFVYQTYYAEDFSRATLSQSIAMVFEDILKVIVLFLDKVLPFLVAHQNAIVIVLVFLIVMLILLVGLRMALKLKGNREIERRIKEAELIMESAKKDAETRLEENKQLKERLIQEFKKKEITLNNTLNEKLAEYKTRIKKLETERMELKTIAGELMQKVKKGRPA
ncbi:hypothetical protein [Desulfosudis oleivorans]|uniref:Uncharacterized protein n=1 Tax=Desulfosudis oleivorans (strain DSM 6200 / JCM 39069 / Hxd3) TaxID=96561 RepID=A8ZUZ1_DESOH|nr:hypothetical protein [Desulfosudis oleivorans]ABW68081.1 hypothetical protein Dole_2277 [Desulfosudis oleivorans Hxd3]